ncbi:DUF1254 domain-containing protein [Nodosilinea sp. P-1105]|nr:DUF1254 domain-containing protein [Nodosilinea sp. P-1105]
MSTLTPTEARAIAKEAYIYGFPLVDNYRIMHSYFVDSDGSEFKAPWNQIHNEARVYTPADKAIQTPNSDTPYSQLGTDLRTEPLVLTVPEIEPDRYYSLQFIDLYTFNYAYVSSRTTGNGAGRYLLAGPYWQGETPAGIDAVIRSETELGWVLYRTQLIDPDDIDNVKAVQAGYEVQPLSSFMGQPAPEAAPAIDFIQPLTPEDQRTSPRFFEVLNFLLQFSPTHPSEQALMERFAKLGIDPDSSFDVDALSPPIQEAIAQGMADAWETFADFKRTQIDTGKRTAADGFGTREFLDNDYLGRMASAVLGIYGNSKEEALYPAYFVDASGEPLDAAQHNYVLRFPPDELPPVNAFWSITMYESPASLLVENPIDRYLINSPMLPDLVRDADGGLTLYLQHDSPGAEKEANWLPAPDGEFITVMRLYWPQEAALTGAWQAPPLQKADAEATAGVPVTVDNFVRAESDLYLGSVVQRDALGQLDHNREPTPIDQQDVIRMNRDTLYSATVFDLEAGPATITLPDAGDRFLSMQLINQDHYTPAVIYEGGPYTLTQEDMGTRYVLAAIRILADGSDPADLAQVHALQDAITIEQASQGTFSVPQWDLASQKQVRDALLVLASTLPDTRGMFGTKEQVDPVRHLIGTALGWGGNPETEALYLNVTPAQNDGSTVYRLTIDEVPVDGFWSISMYNAEGYFEPNDLNAYSINNLTADKGEDGSVTVQFGGCDGNTTNCLPITPGWNYMVRLYRPRSEILDGTWTFPEAEPVQ